MLKLKIIVLDVDIAGREFLSSLVKISFNQKLGNGKKGTGRKQKGKKSSRELKRKRRLKREK